MNTVESGHAVRTVPVYEVLAADIKSLGVEAVFGLMSDDTALFVTALDMAGITFHGARHENAAISMAEVLRSKSTVTVRSTLTATLVLVIFS